MVDRFQIIKVVTLQGRARPQYGAVDKDEFLHWRLEVLEPYPHIIQFGIVPDGDHATAPYLHDVEEADEVRIEFALTSRTESFDGTFPALETSLGRISITKAGPDGETD